MGEAICNDIYEKLDNLAVCAYWNGEACEDDADELRMLVAVLEAERDRMKPVVEAACAWEDALSGKPGFSQPTEKLHWAVKEYQAALGGGAAERAE